MTKRKWIILGASAFLLFNLYAMVCGIVGTETPTPPSPVPTAKRDPSVPMAPVGAQKRLFYRALDEYLAGMYCVYDEATDTTVLMEQDPRNDDKFKDVNAGLNIPAIPGNDCNWDGEWVFEREAYTWTD